MHDICSKKKRIQSASRRLLATTMVAIIISSMTNTLKLV